MQWRWIRLASPPAVVSNASRRSWVVLRKNHGGLLKFAGLTIRQRIVIVALLAVTAIIVGCSDVATPDRSRRASQATAEPTTDVAATVSALVNQRL